MCLHCKDDIGVVWWGLGSRCFSTSMYKFGITSLSNVEDIYPCSGSQQWAASDYDCKTGISHVYTIFELQPLDGSGPIDASRVERAWVRLVARHTTLQTILVSSAQRYIQVVMKRVVPVAKTIQCADSEVLPVFRKYLSDDLPLDQYILHRLTLTSTESGRVFGMIELHHFIGDKGA